MAHLAVGSNWTTTIEFVNPNATATDLEVEFFDPSGEPAAFPVDGNPRYTLPVNVPGNGSFHVALRDPSGMWARTGSAAIRIVSGSAVGVSATYLQETPNHAASVPVGTSVSALTFAFDNSAGKSTGFALANSTTAALQVTATAYDNSGARLLSWDITLPAHGQSAFSLSAAKPELDGVSGVLSFTSASPGLSGFALLFQGDRFRPSVAY